MGVKKEEVWELVEAHTRFIT
uniref:Macaca fascicularis brain cDNA, clone: QflA-19287 n=1 Tax=Macaca fascicularis TaxID=9541 RepID=I7GN17_MACFA|nr:unnamed protein product [Macaca fascicularis]